MTSNKTNQTKKTKYFGTDGIRGKVGQFPITPEFLLKLGWAVGKIFSDGESRPKILIGKDTRISGYMFEAALEAGLSAAGADSRLLGPMPTPAIAYLTRTFRAQAGIVISASHNPYEDNGVKFFSSEGFKLSHEIELAIEEMVEKPLVTVDSSRLGKAKRVNDAPGRYIEFCKSTIGSDMTLKGIKIVVDCANGATYHIAPAVLGELGAEVVTIGDAPDGFNINQSCGATDLGALKAKVLEERADIGIALDGDGDRLMMVDHKGEVVDGDELLYIMASELSKQGIIEGGVVGTLMSNFGVEKAIRDLGLEFVRAHVGDKYVLAELLKRNWRLGGESSGHLICRNYMTTGDGIVSAMQVLRILRKNSLSLHEAKSKCVKFPQIMINVKYSKSSKDLKKSGESNVLEAPQVVEAVAKTERVLGDRGRVLLRASGTEPLIRVMVEGEDGAEIKRLAESLAEVVSVNS